MSLKDALKTIRAQLGFRSARAFYLHIEKTATLDFNYAYYARIENGAVIPSSKVISTLSSILDEPHSDLLVSAYFLALFPRKKHLLKAKTDSSSSPSRARPQTSPGVGNLKQKTLTERQISVIANSESHYLMFLVLTLARYPVTRGELAEAIPGFDVTTLADLEKEKLIREDAGKLESICNDLKFPAADTRSLKEIYSRLDSWDLKLGSLPVFERLAKKTMLRRVSPALAQSVSKHIELLIDLLRLADETSKEHLDQVLLVNLNLSKGALPG